MKAAELRLPVILGLGGGMRTFMPPAMLALHGRMGRRGRTAALLVAGGELVADKLPQMRTRLEPGGLGARAISSGLSARALAGDGAAPVAAAVALASAFACARGRAALAARTGSDVPWAVLEDALSVGLVALAVRAG